MIEVMDDPAGFDWDDGIRAKCQKHGVSIEEIETLFRSGAVAVRPDVHHSASEARFQAIGPTGDGRFAFVAFTFRKIEGKLLLRPISARYMHAKEITRFEKDTTPQDG